LIVGEISLLDLESIYRRMKLPEPLVYVYEDEGLITGYIHPDQGTAHVEHMIVLPEARRKFHTMMAMSRDCTALLHARGLDVILKILNDDPRTGLRAWAKRMQYETYLTDSDAVWYVNRAPRKPNG